MDQPTEQHVYHHTDRASVTINVTVEKNSRGYNWSITVMGAESWPEAVDLTQEADQRLRALYGQPTGSNA